MANNIFTIQVILGNQEVRHIVQTDGESYLFKTFNIWLGTLKRKPDGSWIQYSGRIIPDQDIKAIGEAIDEQEARSELDFGFGLTYEDKLVYCEIINQVNGGFKILFDSKEVAEVELDENLLWKIKAGQSLPEETIDEIGKRINDHYA